MRGRTADQRADAETTQASRHVAVSHGEGLTESIHITSGEGMQQGTGKKTLPGLAERPELRTLLMGIICKENGGMFFKDREERVVSQAEVPGEGMIGVADSEPEKLFVDVGEGAQMKQAEARIDVGVPARARTVKEAHALE